MDKINEVEVLTNPRLSAAQQYILAKLIATKENPVAAYTAVSSGKNIVANRDILVKLGMIVVGANEANITEKGIEAAKTAEIADDLGELTELGRQLAEADDLEAAAAILAQGKPPELPSPEAEPTPEPKPMGAASQDMRSPEISFESWSMISDMQEDLTQKEFLKAHTSKTYS